MYLKDEKEKFMQYNSSWDLNRASTYIYAKTSTENITQVVSFSLLIMLVPYF